MKAKQILAALSAVVIAAVSFSGCAVGDIARSIRWASVPHIDKDSVYIKEFEKNKNFFYEQNISYKPDKAAKSKLDSFTEKLKKHDYTLREYSYIPDYGEDYFYEDYYTYLIDGTDHIGFDEYIYSGNDHKNIDGDYLVKNGKPIIDKKTEFGACGEEIYVDGQLFLKYPSSNYFEFIDDPDGFISTSTSSYISLLNRVDAGTLTIGGKKYDAERLMDVEEDGSYEIFQNNIIYYDGAEFIVAYDENGDVFAILTYIDGKLCEKLAVVYEQNEDNSDKIKAPNDDEIDGSDI